MGVRKNRRDPQLKEHDLIWNVPAMFTRAARRAAGYRLPTARSEAPLPRALRRGYVKAITGPDTRRTRKLAARLGRIMQARGEYLAGRNS